MSANPDINHAEISNIWADAFRGTLALGVVLGSMCVSRVVGVRGTSGGAQRARGVPGGREALGTPRNETLVAVDHGPRRPCEVAYKRGGVSACQLVAHGERRHQNVT
jgi:hypothetical protein